MKDRIIVFLIILLALGFRAFNLDWDENQHLHPDERFLTMVLSSMELPKSIPEYFNPQLSKLNPYNLNYSFFVYGTFPLNLVRLVGELVGRRQYWDIYLVGRAMSVTFDLLVVALVWRIASILFDRKAGIYAAFFYAIMVLPIQLSHFFTVDPYLNFFLVLSFYFAIIPLNRRLSASQENLSVFLSAQSFALALACKVSAIYFLPLIALVLLVSRLMGNQTLSRKLLSLSVVSLFYLLTVAFSFRLLQPHVFSSASPLNFQINRQFIANLKELKSYSDPQTWFPPAIQWKATTPVIYPLSNLAMWGLGLPLAFIVFFSLLLFVFLAYIDWHHHRLVTPKKQICLSMFVWMLLFFVYQGSQFVKTMRYFNIIYPFLAVFAGYGFVWFRQKLPQSIRWLFGILVIILISIYPVSFMSIYTHRSSRLAASEWIYRNVSPGSTLTFEHWDDALPAHLPGYVFTYRHLELPMFAADDEQKWQEINQKLLQVDYLIMSSNRLYGTIPRHPDHYPISSDFYRSLLNDSHPQFYKVAEFASRPCFPPFGRPLFCYVDDNAEEAFTVYDHPKVLIFRRKAQSLPPIN